MKQIYRRTTHKKLGGVASGLADYFEIDPIITRALFVFGFFLGGSTMLLYIILWFMMPKDFEVMNPNGFGNYGFRNQHQQEYYNNYTNSNNENIQFSNIKNV